MGFSSIDNLVSNISGGKFNRADWNKITGAIGNMIAIPISTELTPATIAQAVWEALAAQNNTTGSMGEKLNDAGAAGNPWAALLTDNNTPDTFGALSQAMNALIDELHALQGLKVGQPMTVTPTSRTTGAINLSLSGDGTTTTTVTRD